MHPSVMTPMSGSEIRIWRKIILGSLAARSMRGLFYVPAPRLAFPRHRPQRLIETGTDSNWTGVAQRGIQRAWPKRQIGVHSRRPGTRLSVGKSLAATVSVEAGREFSQGGIGSRANHHRIQGGNRCDL